MDCNNLYYLKKCGSQSGKFILASYFICLPFAGVTNAAPTVEQSTLPPVIVLDNTAALDPNGVITNLQTGYRNTCSKSDAIVNRRCNSINISPENFQVLRGADDSDDLLVEIGADNPKSTSYNNKGTETALDLFEGNQHLINLNRIRSTADRISSLNPALPEGSYGTISWQQFIQNVANAQTMYGIVRVKVPLQAETIEIIQNTQSTGDDDDHDSEHDDDDHDSDHQSSETSDDSNKTLSSHSSGDDDEIEDDDGHESETVQYTVCTDRNLGACGCAPDGSTNIEPGQTICGISIANNAQIDVRGAILFDWVDASTGAALSPQALPQSPADLYFKVTVPINVNPASPRDGDKVMSNIDQIAAISVNNRCGDGAPCSTVLNSEIPFYLVSQESKDEFRFLTGISLTANVFRNLNKIEQYHLLFPSGYADGWALAFSKLGITAEQWQSWGFKTPNTSGVMTANDVRSEAFEDIPAYMYSGGFVDMHYHVNISGLIYAFQALELEQKGLFIQEQQTVQNTPQESNSDDDDHDDDGHDDDGHDDDNSSDHHESSSSHEKSTSGSSDDDHSGSHEDGDDDDHERTVPQCGSESESDDDGHDDDSNDDDDSLRAEHSDSSSHHEKSSSMDHNDDVRTTESHDSSDDDDHNESGSVRIASNCDSEQVEEIEMQGIRFPAKQYISGAMIVKEAFYLEAKYNGGVTLVSNNANNYSNIVLSESSGASGKFEAFPSSPGTEATSLVNRATEYKFARQLAKANDKTADADKDAKLLSPGPQWVEVRPQ